MKKISVIIICSVIITLLLTGIKVTLTPVLMKNANYGISALCEKGEVDDLFIGSSMFRQGIDTPSLENKERSTYLLAYNGNQPFSEYLQIKEVVENGVKIDTLYVDMYSYSIIDKIELSDIRIVQDVPWSFTMELYDYMRAYGNYNPKHLYELSVKANNEMFYTWPVSYKLINDRYLNGGAVSKTAGKTEESLNNLKPDFFKEKELNNEQTTALDNLIKLCNQNNTKVVFLETPKYKRIYDSKSYESIMGKYVDFLKQYDVDIIISSRTAEACALAERENVIIYNFDSSKASAFTDLLHMSSEGREEFSLILKDIIEEGLVR